MRDISFHYESGKCIGTALSSRFGDYLVWRAGVEEIPSADAGSRPCARWPIMLGYGIYFRIFRNWEQTA